MYKAKQNKGKVKRAALYQQMAMKLHLNVRGVFIVISLASYPRNQHRNKSENLTIKEACVLAYHNFYE